MKRLTCKPQPDKETSILIGAGIRAQLPAELGQLDATGAVVALVDPAVLASYPELVPDSWRRIELPGGEDCKTFTTLESVLRQMARWRLDRDTVLPDSTELEHNLLQGKLGLNGRVGLEWRVAPGWALRSGVYPRRAHHPGLECFLSKSAAIIRA